MVKLKDELTALFSDSVAITLNTIEQHEGQVIYVLDTNEKVIGSVSDGDVRRFLIAGGSLESTIDKACNKNFVHASVDDDNERILKIFDNKNIKSLPLLDDSGCLSAIVRPEALGIPAKTRSEAYARAPGRIGFGGGGSDLTSFFNDSKGAVLNCAITKYARASISLRADQKYCFKSYDLGEEVIYDSFDKIRIDGKLDLLKCAFMTLEEFPPITLTAKSDIPVGSGLGGSSALVVAVITAISKLLGIAETSYSISEKAFLAERLIFASSGGWQDQYASAFGGLNFMEFSLDSNMVLPIKLDSDDFALFQEWCFLIDSRISHNGSEVHLKIKQETDYKEKYKQIAKQCYVLRDNLMRGNMSAFADNLNKSWEMKRKLNKEVSSSSLDQLYEDIIASGASGAKLLGAGGGGYFLALVNPSLRSSFVENIISKGHHAEDIVFDLNGAIGW